MGNTGICGQDLMELGTLEDRGSSWIGNTGVDRIGITANGMR
jgi:hypothetical protein